MSREAYRWRKKLICLGLACLMFLSGSLAACGRQTEQSAYHIEYLNKDKNRLVEEPYEPSATDTDGMIKEFLAKLSSDSDNVDYRKPIPNDVEITNYSLDGVLLTLHFDEDYSKMSAVDEVLCRAAVVRTMTQIDGVDCVAFYIGDAPLTDAKGNLVGTMNQDSFIENPGEQINSIQNTTLTLYFPIWTGTVWSRKCARMSTTAAIFPWKTDYGAAFRRSEDQGCKVCDSGGDQACLCVGGGRRLLRQPG